MFHLGRRQRLLLAAGSDISLLRTAIAGASEGVMFVVRVIDAHFVWGRDVAACEIDPWVGARWTCLAGPRLLTLLRPLLQLLWRMHVLSIRAHETDTWLRHAMVVERGDLIVGGWVQR